MVTLDTLKAVYDEDKTQLQQFMKPTSSALENWPEVNLTEDMAFYMRQGQPVLVPHAPTEGWVRLNVGGGRFLGMGQILDDGRVAPKRLLGQGA